ncbi:MAG: hypothetical protein COT81_01835 [Candidatus Buchananbacteria bacterium CG10_big_fil_rev_8_21_14_0_10_42_9]|uniref:Uncharacterized protein n=1 Tax=Candidatus Buchananbacteria bacterium CG10_big_fil_rev_8_21_14_0_10_42_9 TaxID=1974526 RepID=A0A2H0W3Q9_9BACT|nr:MAG: hypothetical protein COT81_01835 [Candidatus Buchananbacteria bacterium CG10_big_fil_rev_8_21_14_0_10_42_9]
MPNSGILLVARDKAPSLALSKLAAELQSRETAVIAFLGHGNPIIGAPDQIVTSARKATAVVIGVSSSPKLSAQETLAGYAAIEAGVPLYVYCDTYGCHWQVPTKRNGLREFERLRPPVSQDDRWAWVGTVTLPPRDPYLHVASCALKVKDDGVAQLWTIEYNDEWHDV